MNRLHRGLLALAIGLSALPALAQNCMLRDGKLRGSYVGDCVRGWANGQGRAEGQDQYEGAFLDGHAHGQGVYTFADGSRFEGQFTHGRVNGRARFFYPGGDMLEGEFRNNRLSGVGQLRKPGGELQLVELRGATLMVVPQAAPVQVAQAQAAGTATSSAAPPVLAGPPEGWAAQVDFGDVFPSVILATATVAPEGSMRSMAAGLSSLREVMPGRDAAVAPAVSTRAVVANAGVTYLGDRYGMLGLRLRNDKPGTRVTVAVRADEIAEPTEASFTLERPGDYALYPKLRYRFDQLRGWRQPGPMNVTWSVWIDGQPRGSDTRAVRLRAVNDLPLMYVSQQGLQPMTWVAAGFVTEDAAWVPELLREAMAPYKFGALGYQADGKYVDLQVKAVYDMLKRRGVKYSSITATAGARDKVWNQFVRFPSESVQGAEANCLDGTVLMATLLMRMGLQPIIVTGPGHALLAYVRDPNLKSQTYGALGYVETTVISSQSFEEAFAAGRGQVLEWAANAKDDPRFGLVSVRSARGIGVMPITR